MSIQLTSVESTQIQAIGYDAATGTLAIQFKSNGAVYHYDDFPKAAWDEFRTAESIGRFFGKHIKGAYRYQRQEGT